MKKKTEEQRALDAMTNGKKVDVEIQMEKSSVISVRLSREVLRQLEIQAKQMNVGVTTYARLAIEEKLALSETETLARMAQVFSSLASQFDHLKNSEGPDADSKAS